MNLYTAHGNVCKDAEVRFTQGGMAICSFTLAVSFGYGDNKGTNFIRCSLFGKKAESKLPEYIKKGVALIISGELRIREYEDRDGNKRTSVEVSADKLDLIGGKNDNASQQPSPQQNQQPSGNKDPFADVPVDDDLPF